MSNILESLMKNSARNIGERLIVQATLSWILGKAVTNPEDPSVHVDEIKIIIEELAGIMKNYKPGDPEAEVPQTLLSIPVPIPLLRGDDGKLKVLDLKEPKNIAIMKNAADAIEAFKAKHPDDKEVLFRGMDKVHKDLSEGKNAWGKPVPIRGILDPDGNEELSLAEKELAQARKDGKIC